MKEDPERSVRACYSSWGRTYFDDYYGPDAPYPPVHVDLVRAELLAADARSVLDAGCGPASMLRLLPGELQRYGFDVTPEMVQEARRVLGLQSVPSDHVWEGSVLDERAFVGPGGLSRFDAVLCVGVLPHVPEGQDERVIENLRRATRPGGRVLVEARNQLFALFSLNRYTSRLFLNDLVPVERLRAAAGEEAASLEVALTSLEDTFRNDLPPLRAGSDDEPGYDEVISRTHNPLVLRDLMVESGFAEVGIRFYHWHALPPQFGEQVPATQRAVSLELERPDDWRGLVMASAFLVVGTRQ